MGIKRLFSNFRPLIEDTNISRFRGAKMGIDGMGWLYQAFFGFGDYDFDLQNPLPLIRLLENKIKLLEKFEIQVCSKVHFRGRWQRTALQKRDFG